jgi:hypothetical protein
VQVCACRLSCSWLLHLFAHVGVIVPSTVFLGQPKDTMETDGRDVAFSGCKLSIAGQSTRAARHGACVLWLRLTPSLARARRHLKRMRRRMIQYSACTRFYCMLDVFTAASLHLERLLAFRRANVATVARGSYLDDPTGGAGTTWCLPHTILHIVRAAPRALSRALGCRKVSGQGPVDDCVSTHSDEARAHAMCKVISS